MAVLTQGQRAALPPLTGIDAPLMNEALSEATKRMASAISSERPKRLSGTPEAKLAFCSFEPAKRASMSVSIGPGATTFTRMPNGAPSRAADLVSPSTACLLAT
jgi:hypothetical protein